VIGEQYAKGSVVIINNERTRYSWKRLGGGPLSSRDFGSRSTRGRGCKPSQENEITPPGIHRKISSGDVAAVVPPGPQNPLGSHELYLGDTLYRIHRPGLIGGAGSRCFACTTPTSSICTKVCKSALTCTLSRNNSATSSAAAPSADGRAPRKGRGDEGWRSIAAQKQSGSNILYLRQGASRRCSRRKLDIYR
jgi:hypothetical protein